MKREREQKCSKGVELQRGYVTSHDLNDGQRVACCCLIYDAGCEKERRESEKERESKQATP